MQRQFVALLVILTAATALAADAPQTFTAAKAVWEKSKDRAAYQTYASEFAQFNNHFRLDEKDGCYTLASGPVNLMLVISKPAGDAFAVVERVLTDVDNAKSRCFKKSYSGVRTKVPPFLPFVLQMGMG
jgi:hypothetical protein